LLELYQVLGTRYRYVCDLILAWQDTIQMRYFIIPVTSLEAHGWQAPQAQLTRTYTKSAVNLVANETGCSCTTSTKVQNVYLISWNHVCWGAGWTDGREWGVLVWSKKCGPFDILDTLELLFSHRNLPSFSPSRKLSCAHGGWRVGAWFAHLSNESCLQSQRRAIDLRVCRQTSMYECSSLQKTHARSHASPDSRSLLEISDIGWNWFLEIQSSCNLALAMRLQQLSSWPSD